MKFNYWVNNNLGVMLELRQVDAVTQRISVRKGKYLKINKNTLLIIFLFIFYFL